MSKEFKVKINEKEIRIPKELKIDVINTFDKKLQNQLVYKIKNPQNLMGLVPDGELTFGINSYISVHTTGHPKFKKVTFTYGDHIDHMEQVDVSIDLNRPNFNDVVFETYAIKF